MCGRHTGRPLALRLFYQERRRSGTNVAAGSLGVLSSRIARAFSTAALQSKSAARHRKDGSYDAFRRLCRYAGQSTGRRRRQPPQAVVGLHAVRRGDRRADAGGASACWTRGIQGASVAQIQAALSRRETTSAELVAYYVERIRRIDHGRHNAVLELNPDALRIAAQLDAERSEGRVRGPLHGIPVTLKANIGTGDAMHTSAGAAALAALITDRDAYLVTLLRKAGAVILAKNNLSEWANFYTQGSINGFSVLGWTYAQSVRPVRCRRQQQRVVRRGGARPYAPEHRQRDDRQHRLPGVTERRRRPQAVGRAGES
ncbi:MAG: hypothetical protein HND48_22940 [Chloroflexi bacterium]|nr:hypothetical protein [Chloroflexota bacterium]